MYSMRTTPRSANSARSWTFACSNTDHRESAAMSYMVPRCDADRQFGTPRASPESAVGPTNDARSGSKRPGYLGDLIDEADEALDV